MSVLQRANNRNKTGSSLGNLWVDINGKTKSNLSASNVPAELKTAERLYDFQISSLRNTNAAASGALYGPGELQLGDLILEIQQSGASVYVEQMAWGSGAVPKIMVYRYETVNGVLVEIDKYEFDNVFITGTETNICEVDEDSPMNARVKFQCRYEKLTHTNTEYDQTGQKKGQNVSTVDVVTGVLGGAAG